MKSLRESILNKKNIVDISRSNAEVTEIMNTLEEIFVDFTNRNKKLFEPGSFKVLHNYEGTKSIVFTFKPRYSELLQQLFQDISGEIVQKLPSIQVDHIESFHSGKNKNHILYLTDQRVEPLPEKVQIRSEFMRLQVNGKDRTLIIVTRDDTTFDTAIEKCL